MNKKSKYLRGIIAITLLTSIPVFVPGIVSPFQNTEVKADSETDTKTIVINTGDLVVKSGDPVNLNDPGEGSLEITDDFAKDANNSNKLNSMKTASYDSSVHDLVAWAFGDGTSTGPYFWETPGVYYQRVSYKLYNSGDTDIDKMIDDPSSSGYTVTINGKSATSGNLAQNNYQIDSSTGTISVVRKITVEGGTVTSDPDIPVIQYRMGDYEKTGLSELKTAPSFELVCDDDKVHKLNNTDVSKFVTNDEQQIIYYDNNPLIAGDDNKDATALNDSSTGSADDVLNKKGIYYRMVYETFNLTKVTDPTVYNFGKYYKIVKKGISYQLWLPQKIIVLANKDAETSIKDLSVTEGTKAIDKSLTDLSSDQLTQSKDTGDGSSMAATPTTDGKYYDADPLAEDSKAKEVSDPLKTEGTYYRLLTFTLNDGINPDDFNFDGGKLSDDNKTVQYTQKVVVSPKPKSSGSSSSHHSESWTTKSQPGIVTTHSDQAYYTLYNDADKIVSNRALAKKTSWYTDRSRTDQYGNVQYHVATDEWINASSVTFNQEPIVSQGLKNIKEDSGILYADKEASYYLLYDKNDKQISNRALGPNSYWKVDQTATDNSGNTYYRVATNEWVKQSDGISFK